MLGRGTVARVALSARALSARKSPAVVAQGRRMGSSNAPINHWMEPKNIKNDHARTLLGQHGPVENQDVIESSEILSLGFARHRKSMPFLEIYPGIAVDSFVAPNVTVIGDVMISHRVIVSYGCVIRGDENVVSIFPGTVIQENCVITADAAVSNMSLDTDGQGGRVADFPGEVVIECSVQIGPGCVLRACKVEMEAVIGAGSILCEGSIVEEGAVLEPGSVVPPGRRVPAGTQWGGNPIKYIRDVESWDAADWKKKLKEDFSTIAEHTTSCYPIENYNMLHKDASAAFAAGK